MCRAAIYIRVSTDRQEEFGSSLETQEARCRSYCDERGYVIVATYSDTHTGSQYRERAGLSRLRELVRSRGVDVVVAYAIDRLSRNQAHLYIVVEEITDHGATVEFVTEDFADSAVGRFLRSAKAFASEIEREKIAERTLRGKLARAQSGKYSVGPKAPYGYQFRDDAKTALDVREDEALVVRRIYDEYLRGASMRQITRSLNDAGTPTASGNGVWFQSVVQKILTNRAYVGDGFAWLYSGNSNVRHVESAIAYPSGVVPPIVDRDTFERAQERLRLNKQRATRNAYEPEAAMLRGGFVVCGYCDYSLGVERQSKARPYIYRCKSTHHRNGVAAPSISVALLDRNIWSRVAHMLSHPETARLADDVVSEEPEPDTSAIERALVEIERATANVTRAIAQLDAGDVEPLVEQLRVLGARKRRLVTERDAIERQFAASERRRRDLASVIELYGSDLDALSWTQRREVLDVLGIRVTLYNTDHRPRYRVSVRSDAF